MLGIPKRRTVRAIAGAAWIKSDGSERVDALGRVAVPIGQIVSESEGDVIVVTLRGEHDLSTAPVVRAELEQAVATGAAIVVDMTETQFIDSSILGVLVEGYRSLSADAGRELAVAAAPGGPVTRLLDLVAVSDVLQVYPTRADALAALDGRAAS